MGIKLKSKWGILILASALIVGGLIEYIDRTEVQMVTIKSPESSQEMIDNNDKKEEGNRSEISKDEQEKEEEDKKETEKELVVIRYGSHYAEEEDPNYQDPLTGEYYMDEIEREIRLRALQIVKEELGVDLQFVQYQGDVTEVLLQSVLAKNPIADIVSIDQGAQGTVLGQNILQPVDDYAQFIPQEPADIYGKKYFISIGGNKEITPSPLVYNIAYIEQVPGLKVNGETIYPTDLYLRGDWTWSMFKIYLTIIDSYYANSQVVGRTEERIEAYKTDYRHATLQAIHTNGGSIYGQEGLEVDSPETIEAVAYIKNLIDNYLLKSELVEGTSQTVSRQGANAMKTGATVFSNVADGLTYSIVKELSERGESLGYVPFPRPDHMKLDDPNYKHGRTGGESYAILKGVDEEKIPLAIQAYFLYQETVEELKGSLDGGIDTDILKSPPLAIDIFHPKIGRDMQEIFWNVVDSIEVCEFSDIVGINNEFYKILGDSLFGINGSPTYTEAITLQKSKIVTKINRIEQLLETNIVKDNIKPEITQVMPIFYAFPLGTSLDEIDFISDFEAYDNVDGLLKSYELDVDYSNVDPQVVGKYVDGLQLTILDSAQNQGKVTYPIVIYNPDNTEAPRIIIKEMYKTIPVGTDRATINWKKDFIAEMVDADGIPVETIEVDVSALDLSNPGVYPVMIKIEDFVGNYAAVSIDVSVE